MYMYVFISLINYAMCSINKIGQYSMRDIIYKIIIKLHLNY